MRNMSLAAPWRSGSSRYPGANTVTSAGAAIMPRPVTTSTTAHRVPATRSSNSFSAARSPS